MAKIYFFPEKINPYSSDFFALCRDLNESATEMEVAEFLVCVRKYTDEKLLSDKQLRKLYKLLNMR